MRSNIAVKVLVLSVLAAMFMVPLTLIWGVVSERARYRDRVADEVAQTSARAQLLFGPILVLETAVPPPLGGIRSGRDSLFRAHHEILLPDSLRIHSQVRVEARQRGIYRVPVYRATHRMVASLRLSDRSAPAPGVDPLAPARAWIVFGISDTRGLRVSPKVTLDGVPLDVQPGTSLPWVAHGFSAPLAQLPTGPVANLEAEIELIGTERVSLVPVGANTDVTMESDWPHPGFIGGFSPDERRITGQGFQARWRLSRFATGVASAIEAREPFDRLDKQGNDIGVRFVQPVDVYQQSERAVKYGMLFVTLTFVAFFLFEILRRLAIHPIQYGLVAAALAIFFLLLVSLSEHVPFAAAYLVSSLACVGLVIFYAGHVLGSLARSLGFGGLLAALYALLYVILQSEDYALLLGTLLLFAALAAVMVATRRVDWFRIGEPATAKD